MILFAQVESKENIMLKEVRASHILVKTEEEANKLREDINAGKITFEEAARQVNMPTSTFRYRAGIYKKAT